jgi:hypothetical protein
MRTWVAATIIGVLALGLVAMSTVAVSQGRALDRSQAQLVTLQAEVDELRDEVARLEARGAGDDAPGGLQGLLDGLLGGLLDGTGDGPGLADLFDGLGGLEGLLDGTGGLDAASGAACILPDGPDARDGGGLFDGLLDGLFGGSTTATDDLDEVVDVVAAQVAELRELDWQRDVEVTFLDGAAVSARLDDLIGPELESDDVVIDQRLLIALHAIPADADLARIQLELLGDQVAGFYATETEELVVRVPDDGRLRPIDLVTLAHELDHALTDQVLGLPDRSAPPYVDDPDAAYGALAVVEGDATLLMQRWAVANLSVTDQLAMAFDPETAAAQAALDGVPTLLQRELLSPYTDGLDWVCDRYLEGGWAAVDAAYDAPPTTSAEVLFGEPIDPATTATLTPPDGYAELRTTTFGAAPLQWLLEAPGDDPAQGLDRPRERVRGWGGGTVLVAARGDDTAVGLALVDTGDASAPLCDSLDAWYAAAVPSATRTTTADGAEFSGTEQAATLRCEGDDVRLGLAPDAAAARQVVGR